MPPRYLLPDQGTGAREPGTPAQVVCQAVAVPDRPRLVLDLPEPLEEGERVAVPSELEQVPEALRVLPAVVHRLHSCVARNSSNSSSTILPRRRSSFSILPSRCDWEISLPSIARSSVAVSSFASFKASGNLTPLSFARSAAMDRLSDIGPQGGSSYGF